MHSSLAEAIDPAYSSLREKMLETIFLADLSRFLWRRGRRDFEVLRSEVDRGGYDLVVACAGVMRHIQMKSRHLAGRRKSVPVSLALAAKPSGCVVWIDYDPVTMTIGPFRFFGGLPGEPLPGLGEAITKHTRGEKKPRIGHRDLKRTAFTVLMTIEDVAIALFGKTLEPDPLFEHGERDDGHIEPQGSDRLTELASFAARLEASRAGGDGAAAEGGEWVYVNADGASQLPFFAYGELLSHFLDMTYRCGWIDADFDWTEWVGTEAAKNLRECPDALKSADERTLSHVLTAVIRSERFGEGALDEAVRSGLLLRAAERAAELKRQSSGCQ